MVIRAVQSSDLADIARLFYETVHRVNAQDYTAEQLEAWAPEIYETAYWQDRFEKCQVYVAQEQEQVVGFAEFEATGHIDCFYVHYQWQRCGVGSRLITQIEADARSQSIPRLFAEVSITARPFFEHHGFVVDQEHEKLYRDVKFTQFLMSKVLVSTASASTDAGLVERLESAIADLVWVSETEAPLAVCTWDYEASGLLTPEQFLDLIGRDVDSAFAEVDCLAFFQPVTQTQDWHGEQEKAEARQYQQLLEMLQTELTNLQVFKVGKYELDIYILGRTPEQNLAGVTTQAVET